LSNLLISSSIKVKREKNSIEDSSTLENILTSKDKKEINKNERTSLNYFCESLKEVELNKTFYSILKNKINISNKENNTPKNFLSQNQFCKKFCGEKLFKNLDLNQNQRFYLKKTSEGILHIQGCPLFKKKSTQVRTKSQHMSYREQRKSSVEKDFTLLDLSLVAVREKSLLISKKNDNLRESVNNSLYFIKKKNVAKSPNNIKISNLNIINNNQQHNFKNNNKKLNLNSINDEKNIKKRTLVNLITNKFCNFFIFPKRLSN